MATKRQHSSSTSEKEDLRRCRQSLRRLLGDLGQTMPTQQPAFQSALLLHFYRASHRVGLTHKPTEGVSHHGRPQQ